jgi:hypothetical protein
MAASVVLVGNQAVAADSSKKPTFVSQRAKEFGVTPALTSLPPELLLPPADKEPPLVINRKNERRVKRVKPGAGAADGAFQDPLVGKQPRSPNAMPAPIITWDGMAAAGSAPPDTNIDVGPSHVVELVNNTRMQVWNKAGTSLLGPISIRTLFAGLPVADPCRAGTDDGDPVVLYDPLADRWLISQFEVDPTPNLQCIAISQTGDPTGAYYAYSFVAPAPPVIPEDKFQDYPHYGVWPDAYYLTTNQFPMVGPGWLGGGAYAFDRAKMLAGDPTASYIYVDVFPIDPNAGGMLPTDVDGYVPPPVGLPQLMMEWRADEFGDPNDALRLYEFVPNFASPGSSTFTVRPDIVVAPFDARQPPNTRAKVEQLGGEDLDSIADRLMFRLAYRNLGTVSTPANSWVGNFSVNVSGVNPTTAGTYQTGIRWFELHSAGTSLPAMFDQGTHNLTPGDGASGLNNWMGSIAQDNQGSLALGFSQSGTGQRADIKIAGRSGSAAAGTLNEGEAVMYAAAGSQTATSNRWGDYSSMSVDPADDCTFWYAQEYYAITGSFVWRTRIGSFVYPGCTPAPKGTLDVTVTNCVGGAPISGAQVAVTGGFLGMTNGSGLASFTTAPGIYTVTATKAGYTTGSTGATVTNGGTTAVGVCITGTPVMAAGTSNLVAETCSAANTAIDPGEAVTMSFCVTNSGGADTVSLVGTLQATGGVTAPGPGQTYGVVTAGGPAVCANHDFVASAALSCGASITASLQLQDGVTNLGTVTYPLGTGGLGAPGAPVAFSYTGSPVAIPDDDSVGVNATLPVSGLPAGSIVNDVNFRFDAGAGTCDATVGNTEAGVDHTWVGDLVFKLTSPGGPVLTFVNRPGSGSFGYSGNNICTTLLDDYADSSYPSIDSVAAAPVQGDFSPDSNNSPDNENVFAGFDGLAANGTWTLNASDNAGGDTGSVRRFSLIVTAQSRICSASCSAPSDLIFKDGFQTP